MKDEDLVTLEVMVEDMLNNLYNSDLLDGFDDFEDKEEQCIKEMINILKNRLSYY
jgi:hypothetical protein